jgi:N6-L-threonylcarbamoyladenine synthase
VPLFVPPLSLSTDNAAMIAASGFVSLRRGVRAGWDLNAEPHLALG